MRTLLALMLLPLLAGHALAQRPIHSLRGHLTQVSALEFHPEGKLLASIAGEREIFIWDLDARAVKSRLAPSGRDVDGRRAQPLVNQRIRLETIHFGPDGLLAVASDEPSSLGTLRLWNVDSGLIERNLMSNVRSLRAAAYSPDGGLLAVTMRDGDRSEQKIVLINPDDGATVREFLGERLAATMLTWSPDGKQLVSAGGRVIHIWDVASGKALRTISTHKQAITCLAMSPDGERFATADTDEHFRIWRLREGRLDREVKHEQKSVHAMTFSPDGEMIATGGDDTTIRVWNARSGRRLAALWGHGDRVTAVRFSPDGRWLASGSRDHNISIWESPKSGQ